MNIDTTLLGFPKTLPNDMEGFIFYYPQKFPQIKPYFEEIAAKVAADPKAYQEYGNWAKKELWQGFEKVKKDYEEGDQTNLAFLVKTDQRFNKLFCFRFWIVNYLFADGPLHDYFVDNLKNLIRKFIDVTEDIEDFEDRVIRIQRDLLQSDYADLYLRQALSGVKIVEQLKQNSKLQSLVKEVTDLIDAHSESDSPEISKIWDKVVSIIQDKDDPSVAELREELAIPLGQAEMRKTMSPVYHMLTHAVEFRNENEGLTERQGEMKDKIETIFKQAKEKLSQEEFELFDLSYQQARNFSIYKDVMGEIDPVLLPLWFGIHNKAKAIIKKEKGVEIGPGGHACMFYQIVWELPADLKNEVMTPDQTAFSLETL